MNGTEVWLALRKHLLEARAACMGVAARIRDGGFQASDLHTGIMQKGLTYQGLVADLLWDLASGKNVATKDYGVDEETFREWGLGPLLGAAKSDGGFDRAKFQQRHERDQARLVGLIAADMGEALDAATVRARLDTVIQKFHDAVLACEALLAPTDGGASDDFTMEKRKIARPAWERRPRRMSDLGAPAQREAVAATLDEVAAAIDALLVRPSR